MESETFRVILLTIFIPFAGYKVYKFFKKLYKLSELSFKEKLEIIFKIWFELLSKNDSKFLFKIKLNSYICKMIRWIIQNIR